MRILGMMSGTSFDGIDSALCNIEYINDEIQIEVLDFQSNHYPSDLHKMIVDAMPPRVVTMETVCILDTLIGQAFANAADSIIKSSTIIPDLIVSHGQTMFHLIDKDNKARGTLQLGEPTWIAEKTGVQVLSNIRSRDVAALGHGAPLVSILDQLLLSDNQVTQAALNLGGISNITIVTNSMEPIAYDIGPANGLMDAAIFAYSKGKATFDTDGKLASEGKINATHLKKFLSHPYYTLSAPKSTGKEIFHLPYVIEIIGPIEDWVIEDVLATLLEVTVETVANEVEKFKLSSIYIAGGGASNQRLMLRLQERLGSCKVLTIDELGISTQSKEALAFALIGFLTVHGLPGQLPSCTGASGERLLGSLTPGKKPYQLPNLLSQMPKRVRIIH